MPTVELRFSALPTHVRTARLIAAAVGRRAGVDEAVIDEVKLATGEACARAVGLHREHAPRAEIVLAISDDAGVFAVEVRDRGPADGALDPTGTLPAIPDLLAAGDDLPAGFGLAVIAGLVDDVDVRSSADGTVVRMAWPLTL